MLVVKPYLIWLFFCLLLSLPGNACFQNEHLSSAKLLIGVIDAPPIYFKADNGQWEGPGIEIWQGVTRKMGASFEFLEFDKF